MLVHLKNGIAALDFSCVVQVSMNGPNVNWKFYRYIFQECRGVELTNLFKFRKLWLTHCSQKLLKRSKRFWIGTVQNIACFVAAFLFSCKKRF